MNPQTDLTKDFSCRLRIAVQEYYSVVIFLKLQQRVVWLICVSESYASVNHKQKTYIQVSNINDRIIQSFKGTACNSDVPRL